MLRREEHSFNKSQIDKLEQINTDDPADFWNHIKKLGPRKEDDIPFALRTEDGMTTNEESIVLKTWQNEMSYLLNRPDEVLNKFDTTFFNEKKLQKDLMEDMISSNEEIELNVKITEEKIEKAVEKLKLQKAVGCDEIPNEVLKVPGVWGILCKLFDVCFEKSLILPVWKSAVIKPIPKGGLYDKFCPENYWCISLISYTAKLHTTVLNSRLIKYCDRTGCIEEEQADFQRKYVCINQAFILNSIVRNGM